jgi:hypothetical protein
MTVNKSVKSQVHLQRTLNLNSYLPESTASPHDSGDQSQVSTHGICGERSGINTDFSASTLVLPPHRENHPANIHTHSFITDGK